MVFTSFVFLFLFLPLSLIVFYITPKRFRHLPFLFSSLIFYGYWRLDFLLLIIFSIALDYTCSHQIYNSVGDEKRKKKFLFISIFLNLGLLAYFKYFNFGLENLSQILVFFGGDAISAMEIILPVGISFFTFQTMSYTIDVYRGEIKPSKDLGLFATYVSMFPQLVAGPIVRYSEVHESLFNLSRKNIKFKKGLIQFVIGFNKKVLIANNVSEVADFAFKVNGADTQTAFIGALAYTLQIYFDFSGYSDMAIGLGRMFGFEFPVNFNSPYKSKSITEFWNRWHMTLSRWFKDYLYIPLGGNRLSPQRTYINLFLVMFLCGVWHGAAWTFIIWGCYHAAFLIAERFNGRKALGYSKLPTFFQIAITFFIAMIGWIPFRASSFPNLMEYLGAFLNREHDLKRSAIFEVLDMEKQFFIYAGLLIIFFFKNASEDNNSKYFKTINIINLLLFIPAIHELMNQKYNPFLYFNF